MCTQKSSLWIFFLTPPKCSHKTEKKNIYLECGFKAVNLGEIMQFLALMNANSSTPQKMHTNSQVEVTKKSKLFLISLYSSYGHFRVWDHKKKESVWFEGFDVFYKRNRNSKWVIIFKTPASLKRKSFLWEQILF